MKTYNQSIPMKQLLLAVFFLLLTLSPAAAREEDPARYVVTLLTSREPITATDLGLQGSVRTYVTSFKKGGEVWYRMRLGFFASRKDAEMMIPPLRSDYPTAWATRVTKQEKIEVMTGQIDSVPAALKTAGNSGGN